MNKILPLLVNTGFLWVLSGYFCFTQAQVLQNMVKNPSFEQYRKVPDDLGAVQNIDYWSTATDATPDYYHKRAGAKTVDIPTNKMGSTMPRSGYAYVGIYAYASRYIKRNFREYVQVELKKPMIAGNVYCVKAHVYLSEASNRAVGALGCIASPLKVNESHERYIQRPFEYMIAEDRSNLMKREWIEISCQYKAKGNERFLIIGNFDDDRKTKVTGAVAREAFKNPHVDFAYYFVDDICVTNTRTNFKCDCGTFDYPNTNREERIVVDFKTQKKDYYLGQVIILKGVEFEKGKATMLRGAQKSMDDIIATLRMNKNYHIEISGHTDDRGNPQKNQILSKRRAESVYNYLIASGIGKERLSYRGYGQSRPITLNKTKEGRARNERIQFKIVKK